jgi:hypothetical protein
MGRPVARARPEISHTLKQMRRILGVLLSIVAISACTSANERHASLEVSDSAGVKIVYSHERQWAEGDAWTIPLQPQVSIGVVQGPQEYQLFDVSAAGRQSDGDIIVADGGSRAVRLYDGDGAFVRTLGGRGSGPGEFQSPVQVVVTAGDSVLVWDAKLYRVSRFDPGGELGDVRSVDMAQLAKVVDPPFYPATVQLMPDNELLVRLIEKGGDKTAGSFNSRPRAGRMRSGALRVSMDYSAVDTLMFFGDLEQVNVSAPWGDMLVVPALARGTVIAAHGTSPKICIGEQAVSEIACFSPGEPRTLIRWTSATPAVTDEEIATWRDTMIGLYTLKLREADVVRMLEQVAHPGSRPPYSGITLDRVGNLWVEQGPTSSAAAESVDYLVFDRVGALLGVVALPRVRVLEIGDDYVLGVYQDALDVEYLRVYEIEKS